MLEELRSVYRRHGRSLRSPSFWLLANYRLGRWAWTLPPPASTLGSWLYGAGLTFSEFVLGSTLNRETEVGPDLTIVHADGVRIAPSVTIGARVCIMQSVTIGTAPDRPGVPVIGDDVFIGAGARVLGPVKVGARARIAANSLVVSDVPPDTTAIGVPAKMLRYTGRCPTAAREEEPSRAAPSQEA